MARFSEPLARKIHDSFGLIAAYAFSRTGLLEWRTTRFRGEWEHLDRALFEHPEERVQEACLALATYLRILDDEAAIGDYYRQTGGCSFGKVVKAGQPEEPLYLRDMTNKIIHAARIGWDFSGPEGPRLVCDSNEPERWLRAEIELIQLAVLCGDLDS